MMNSPFRRFLPSVWRVFWVTAYFLVTVSPLSESAAADPASEKELSAMGQGFGKFVGSFMQQLQSEKGEGASHPDQRRSYEPSVPSEDRSVRSERDGDNRSRQDSQRIYVPYRTYDPWGASRWGDPYLGYDPWGQNRSWVDYDWQNRKQQYGWSYGGVSPYDEDRFSEDGEGYRRGMPRDVPFSLGFDEGRREWQDGRSSPPPYPYRARDPYDAYAPRTPYD